MEYPNILIVLIIVPLMAEIRALRKAHLSSRLTRLEQKIDLIVEHLGIAPSAPKPSQRVINFIEDGQLIRAIKAYREETGDSLEDAKKAVEEFRRIL